MAEEAEEEEEEVVVVVVVAEEVRWRLQRDGDWTRRVAWVSE